MSTVIEGNLSITGATEVRDLTVQLNPGGQVGVEGASPNVLRNVTDRGTGGMVIVQSLDARFEHVRFEPLDGGSVVLAADGLSHVEIRDSTFLATGPGAVAVVAQSEQVDIWDSELATDGGTFALTAGSGLVEIRNSRIWADRNSVEMGGATVRVIGSELDAPVYLPDSRITCTATTLADGGFLPTGCP